MATITSSKMTTKDESVPAHPGKKRFFEFLYDEEQGQGTSQDLCNVPRKKMRKSLESLNKYRSWLSWKKERVRASLQSNKQLKEKDMICTLKNQLVEVESQSMNLEPDSKSADHNSNKIQSTVPMKNLLSLVNRLQEDNDKLRNEIKIVEKRERCWVSKYLELYESFQSISEKVEKISRIELECEEKETRIKKLEKENQSLLLENQRSKEYRSKYEEIVNQEVQNICQQYSDIKTELFDDKIKHLEFMDNYKPMVIVENPKKAAFDDHILDAVTAQICDIKRNFIHLRQRVAEMPDATQQLVYSTTSQIQNAVQETNDKYHELFPKYKREIELRKKYHNELVELRGNIRVLCRVRPVGQISEEISHIGGMMSCVSVDYFDDCTIKVNNKGRCQEFEFDKVFMENTTQCQVFDEVSSLVTSVLDGFNACIFAYGQTGSGKTYTMEGPPNDPGINQRALKLLFEKAKGSSSSYSIEASVLEIYNETVRDLLNSDASVKLEVKLKPEGGLHVPGLIEIPVTALEEANQIFNLGRRNRATGATNMNEHSSRSHCLLCVTVTGVNKLTGVRSFGRLNLVDLAGSERVSKSLAEGSRLKEAQNINKSLSCLGDVINALKNKHNHVPYRNSKLTYLLQESLSGDSKTLMILQISPEERDASETLCTLVFGQRVRTIELGAAIKRVEGGTGKSTPIRRGLDGTVKTTPTTGACPQNLTKSASAWGSAKRK